jgi:transcriptional regulator with XRE-family HTH domain
VQPTPKHRRLRDHAFAPGLAAARSLYGGTQEAEARAAGVSWRTWARWEAMEARAPVDKLAAVAGRWGVDVAVLGSEPPAGPEMQLRALVREHGEDEVRAAAGRVIPAL